MSEQKAIMEKQEDLPTYYEWSVDQLTSEFGTDLERGLTKEQAEKSLEIYGPNELKKVKKSVWKVLIAPIINLLIIIYLISAIAMWALGEVQRTTPTFVIVGTNAVIAIVQQFRAEKQLEALQKLSEATAIVIRDGKERELPTERVVVGDLIKLSQGDKIPADCRIINSINLSVDEASLTGESEPVKKSRTGDPIKGDNLPLQDQKNMLFLGTFVAAGSARAIVVRVGSKTEIGKISQKLEEANTGDIPLRKKMNNFAKRLGIAVLVLLTLSIIYKTYLLNKIHMLTPDSFRLALIDSIDLGMKVMPINLPLLTTIVLLTGVLAMAQKGVIVRELSRTESLGRVSVVCSDKTGTLTKNEMTVLKIWTFNSAYDVSGLGYEPSGIVYKEGGEQIPEKTPLLDLLILSGYLNNNCTLIKEEVDILGGSKKKINWTINGLPTEAALKVVAEKYDPKIVKKAKDYEFVYEFNFDSSIKRMSKIFYFEEKPYLFCKGATEWVLPLCSSFQDESGVHSLDETTKEKILNQMKLYASQGYRILSITYRELDKSFVENSDFDDEKTRESYEKDMIFLGLTVILDPPRDDVPDAVKQCKDAGISVVMITGDSITTGRAIAEQIGIFNPETDLAIEGKDLVNITDDEEFKRITCYGRVSPEHKQIIVERYQKMDKLVSMSGDGVNDALALSMADCGLAMGIQGTEVAKEAADMIITDDSFSTIVTGIREGRGLFMKIRTIIYFFICISVMEAIILFSSSLNPNPNFAMFDYWQLNLLYVTAHMFPSLGFTFGSNAADIMKEKPRDSAELVTRDIFKLMLFHMIIMGSAIAGIYYAAYYGLIPLSEYNLTHIGFSNAVTISSSIPTLNQIKARTMAFMVLFILESFFMPLQIRRINNSLKESLKDMDYKLEFWMYIPSILLLIGAVYSMEAQQVIGNLGWTLFFMSLDFFDWLIIILACIPAVVGFELVRTAARKKGVVF